MGWKLPVTGKGLRWNRLVCMDDTRVTRSVFNWECSYKNSNWSTDMKELFEDMKKKYISAGSDKPFHELFYPMEYTKVLK